MENTASEAVDASSGTLRTRILLEVLLGICRDAAGAVDDPDGLNDVKRAVYRSLMLKNCEREPLDAEPTGDDEPSYVERLLGPAITPENLEPLYDEIIDSLNATLDSISRFATGHDPDATETDDAKLERLGDVYDVIKAQHDALESDTDQIRQAHQHIRQLEKDIEEVKNFVPSKLLSLLKRSQIHPRLHASLVEAIQTLPPVLHTKREASHDLLATTIETLLIKLSVLRARAQQAVYGPPERRQALEAAYAKLKDDEAKLAEEEAVMDRQIRDYEAALKIGGASGFKQIVDDYARVQRDTEECRRDLRRLGWAGD
ncbi:uncharacterized protein SCHCODRAFT_01109555 [Schizophyllum commune H4-8]|nr:uncharacterized protein SCHCODRAFT_01109555 [Schizophyllum commune H4-8]KAI5885116.1 hypothetical protein SCHCODRAFT_01109555 [Schizophyllum commune H4-8]